MSQLPRAGGLGAVFHFGAIVLEAPFLPPFLSFIQFIFTEYLLCVRCYARHSDQSCEQDKIAAIMELKSGWSQVGRKKINTYQRKEKKPYESRKYNHIMGGDGGE